MLILKENKLIEFDGNLFTKENKISFKSGEKIKIDPRGKYIVPGFIDQHIHGAGGKDAMDNNVESILEFSKKLLEEGTTSFLPTTMTYDVVVLKEVIDKINQAKPNVKGASIQGVHLEGPFLCRKFIGAQNPIYLLEPNIGTFDILNQHKLIKLVTYAPERDENFEFTKHLKENNIVASVGHSAATCDEVNQAIQNGLSNFTHFHNASTPHHHREPGVVTSGLMNKEIKVELIVDGIHLHKDTVKAVYKIKGYENIILITDSMSAKGCVDGEYDLGGQKVIKKGNEARLEDGTLAGSVLKMNDAVKNMINFSDCKIEEAFIMASYNPAKQLSLSTKGLIKEQYDCDLCILDEEFNVVQTIIGGETKYEKGA